MMTLGSDMLTSPAKEISTVRIVWQLEHKSALHYSLFVGLPIGIVLRISFSISQHFTMVHIICLVSRNIKTLGSQLGGWRFESQQRTLAIVTDVFRGFLWYLYFYFQWFYSPRHCA
jgi:hypothetical protein